MRRDRKEFCRTGKDSLAAAFAFRQDGSLQALSQRCRQLIQLMLTINFDRLPGGIQGDDAVLTLAQMQLEIRTQRGRHGVVNQIVEFGQKFRAGH